MQDYSQQRLSYDYTADRTRKMAHRLTLNSPSLRPFAKEAKRLSIIRWPCIIETDKKVFRKLVLGVAYALSCGWNGRGEQALRAIEEYAWRRRNHNIALESIHIATFKHMRPEQPTLFDLFDRISHLPADDQNIIRQVVVEREQQTAIAQGMGVSQSHVSKATNRIAEQLKETSE